MVLRCGDWDWDIYIEIGDRGPCILPPIITGELGGGIFIDNGGACCRIGEIIPARDFLGTPTAPGEME